MEYRAKSSIKKWVWYYNHRVINIVYRFILKKFLEKIL